MFERFSDRARSVLTPAQEEARLLNHSYIGTEHLLLGIVREGQGAGATVLASLGASPARVRQEVTRLLAEVSDPSGPGGTGAPAAGPSAKPCCPRCSASVADEARFRTIAVPRDVDDPEGDSVTIDVVYRGQCGSTLHMFGTS